MRPLEQPVTKPDENWPGKKATRTTHPAFAQIGASRVSGETYLYGSDFKHRNTIRITIRKSELMRDLSHDNHFGREELIEVELSEAQWATFISTLNVGFGVPCTLLHTGGKTIPGLPKPAKRTDQFMDEVSETLLSTSEGLAKLRGMVEASSLSAKAKKEFLSAIEVAGYGVGANLKFVADTFGKHVEKVTEDAKTEVEAYITSVIQRTGIAVLRGEPPPISLPAPEEGDVDDEPHSEQGQGNLIDNIIRNR